eukprot:scaffold1035_cov115-Cylindrotheca_fusiformis.AAC.3
MHKRHGYYSHAHVRMTGTRKRRTATLHSLHGVFDITASFANHFAMDHRKALQALRSAHAVPLTI